MIIRGREFSTSDINLIKTIITENPTLGRHKLSILISRRLNWRQHNGRLKIRSCLDVLLRLHQEGIINLPRPITEVKKKNPNKQVEFTKPAYEISGTVSDFNLPQFKIVKHRKERRLWNYLIENYHYKGCQTVVGRHLKYLLYLDNALIGCFCFADAVLQLKIRDQWIGWDNDQREAHLHFIINNVRFLILPWVRIRNLASKLLSLSTVIVPSDWQRIYHYTPLLIETFIEKGRFSGTSYKAANWVYLGRTHGKGRSGLHYYYHGVQKDVYVYPLTDICYLRKTLRGQ